MNLTTAAQARKELDNKYKRRHQEITNDVIYSEIAFARVHFRDRIFFDVPISYQDDALNNKNAACVKELKRGGWIVNVVKTPYNEYYEISLPSQDMTTTTKSVFDHLPTATEAARDISAMRSGNPEIGVYERIMSDYGRAIAMGDLNPRICVPVNEHTTKAVERMRAKGWCVQQYTSTITYTPEMYVVSLRPVENVNATWTPTTTQ